MKKSEVLEALEQIKNLENAESFKIILKTFLDNLETETEKIVKRELLYGFNTVNRIDEASISSLQEYYDKTSLIINNFQEISEGLNKLHYLLYA